MVSLWNATLSTPSRDPFFIPQHNTMESEPNPPVLPTYAALAPDIPLPSDLSLKRHYSQSKLRSTWEDIIVRYSDPNIQSDEVDLFSGEIVVDNGHLASLSTKEKRLDLWRPSLVDEEDFSNGQPRKRQRTSRAHHHTDSIPIARFIEPPPVCDKCAELDELSGVVCTHLAREDTAERTDGNGTDAENIPPVTPLRKDHTKVIRQKGSVLRPKPLNDLGGHGNKTPGTVQRNRGQLWKPAPNDPLIDSAWYQEGPDRRSDLSRQSQLDPSSRIQTPTTNDYVEELAQRYEDELEQSTEVEAAHNSQDEEEEEEEDEAAPPSSCMPSSPPILRRPFTPPPSSSLHAKGVLPARTNTARIELVSPKPGRQGDAQEDGYDTEASTDRNEDSWNTILSEISQKSTPLRRPAHSSPPRPRGHPSARSPAKPQTPSVVDSAETTPRPKNCIPSTPPVPTHTRFPSSTAIHLDSIPSTPETPTQRRSVKSLIPFSVHDLHTKAPSTPLPISKLSTSDLVIPETPEENQPKPSSFEGVFETPTGRPAPPKMANLLASQKSLTPRPEKPKAHAVKNKRYTSPAPPARSDEPRSSGSFAVAVEIPAKARTPTTTTTTTKPPPPHPSQLPPKTPKSAPVQRSKHDVGKAKDNDFDTPVKRNKDVRRMTVGKKRVVETETETETEVEVEETPIPKAKRKSVGKKEKTTRVAETEVEEPEETQDRVIITAKPNYEATRRKSVAKKEKPTPKAIETSLEETENLNDEDDERALRRKEKRKEKARRKKRFSWVNLAMADSSRSPKSLKKVDPTIETVEDPDSTPTPTPSWVRRVDPASLQLAREVEAVENERTNTVTASSCGTAGYHCGKLICFLCEEE